jgi:hypothetical protein
MSRTAKVGDIGRSNLPGPWSGGIVCLGSTTRQISANSISYAYNIPILSVGEDSRSAYRLLGVSWFQNFTTTTSGRAILNFEPTPSLGGRSGDTTLTDPNMLLVDGEAVKYLDFKATDVGEYGWCTKSAGANTGAQSCRINPATEFLGMERQWVTLDVATATNIDDITVWLWIEMMGHITASPADD